MLLFSILFLFLILLILNPDYELDLRDLDPLALLSPFLDIIYSPETTGPITATALTAVEKFINHKIIGNVTPLCN